MNYSQLAKNEVVKLKFGADCCRTAFLSAVIHSTGSVVIRDKTLAVEIVSENEDLLEKTASIIRDFYGFEPIKAGRKLVLSGDAAMLVMHDVGIFRLEDGHTVVEEGILLRIGVTPTDILHVQGRYNRWNRDLSNAGVEILARRQEISTAKFLNKVERMIKVKLASACVQAAANFDLAEENRDGSSLRPDQGMISMSESEAAMYLLERAFGSKPSSVIDPQIHLKKRLVAIGAPAGVWLREAGKLLHEDVLVPEHADVANAFGAAVGQVTETVEILISMDKGKYLLNLPWSRMECGSKEEATFYAIHEGRKHIEHLLADAGCRNWKIEEKFSDIMVEISDVEDIQDVQEKTWMGQRVIISGTGSGMI